MYDNINIPRIYIMNVYISVGESHECNIILLINNNIF